MEGERLKIDKCVRYENDTGRGSCAEGEAAAYEGEGAACEGD